VFPRVRLDVALRDRAGACTLSIFVAVLVRPVFSAMIGLSLGLAFDCRFDETGVLDSGPHRLGEQSELGEESFCG
jgi:hypothetical protein